MCSHDVLGTAPGHVHQAHIQSAPIYGQLDMAARKINLAKFRARKCRVLVVTDVAARGIDIPFLDNVINFDFPDKPKLFVHRCGQCESKCHALALARVLPTVTSLLRARGGRNVDRAGWAVSLGKGAVAPRSASWHPRRFV